MRSLLRPVAGIAFVSLSLASVSCDSPSPLAHPEPPQLPASPPPPADPPGYVPGLGEIMTLTQMRHAKLWLAIEAENWELAAYEVDELEEGFADAVAFHPQHKSAPRPLSELVPESMDAPLVSLRAALAQRDFAAAEAAHDQLTAACNACHVAAGFGFNRVVRPSGSAYPNQEFGAGTP